MKIDMANFAVSSLRPHLLQHSVEYERNKFQDFLNKQPCKRLLLIPVTEEKFLIWRFLVTWQASYFFLFLFASREDKKKLGMEGLFIAAITGMHLIQKDVPRR